MSALAIEFLANAHVLWSEFCLVITEPVRHLGEARSLRSGGFLWAAFGVLEADTVIFGISSSKVSYCLTIGAGVN